MEGRGLVRYAGGRPEMVDLGGDLKRATSNALMGEGGVYNTVGFCRRDTAGKSHLGNNGPTPKGEGVVSGYQVGRSDMEDMSDGA